MVTLGVEVTPPDVVKAIAGVKAAVLAVVTVLSVCAVTVVAELESVVTTGAESLQAMGSNCNKNVRS